ncbi:MAG: PAS domain S-box protein [Alphaproteobacteria bacterium]|nr:PAS domain S-box protein [Alphaproteobacteria bacterium]
MKTDHSEFIARHHKPAALDHENERDNPWRIWFALLLVMFYIAVCTVVAIWMNIQQEAVIAAGVAFVVALAISFFIQKTLHIRSTREKEREILHEVMEGSRGGRLITDGADNTVYSNQKFRHLCEGFGAPTLNTLAKLFQSDDQTTTHFRLLSDQAQKGLTDSIELCSRIDDRETWYMVTAQPVSGWAGYIHWRIDDITDRREIDRAIREEREKLIDFTDNAPVGFFSVNEAGQFVFVNATLARWLGEDIETLLSGVRLHTFFNDVPAEARPYDIVSNGGAKQMAEVSMKGPGGKTFMAAINQAVVHEGPGLVRTRGVVHDLTAERAMRQALKVSEDRFQRFFEEAPLGIVMLNSEGVLNDCNQALASMLSYKIEEVEGRHFEALIHEEFRVSVLSTLNRIETGGQTPPLEITLLGRDRSVAVQMFARKLVGSESLVLHFIDLTQQKQLEAQFVQSQKMQAIGQLAGGVAHDFNNLLTAMIGFCDLLLLRHKPGDPSFSDIMQIKQNANRAANLVRQLLAFSRQQTLRPKVQDITDILTEISHLVRRLIGANIELQVIHGQDLGLVKVDAGQMEQVLINLAVNARDAMENGGDLTIRTFAFENNKAKSCVTDEMPPGQWVALAVEDTGTGIPREIMTRILEPFFTTKEVGQGTGLGLATVYGIVRQTGGYLDIESTVGTGTIFTIYLPRAPEGEIRSEDAESIAGVEDDSARDLTGMARILLVEDEDAVRTFSARALANKGYEVLEADSGESALRVIAENKDYPADLVITDVIMPNMDGPTLAKALRAQRPDLKIIFISGYTEEKLKDHMGDNIWFLPKPFTLKQLAAKVKEALEG